MLSKEKQRVRWQSASHAQLIKETTLTLTRRQPENKNSAVMNVKKTEISSEGGRKKEKE